MWTRRTAALIVAHSLGHLDKGFSLYDFCGSPGIFIQINNFFKLMAPGIQPLTLGLQPRGLPLYWITITPFRFSYLPTALVLRQYSKLSFLAVKAGAEKKLTALLCTILCSYLTCFWGSLQKVAKMTPGIFCSYNYDMQYLSDFVGEIRKNNFSN